MPRLVVDRVRHFAELLLGQVLDDVLGEPVRVDLDEPLVAAACWLREIN
jgi:hypothetical protein